MWRRALGERQYIALPGRGSPSVPMFLEQSCPLQGLRFFIRSMTWLLSLTWAPFSLCDNKPLLRQSCQHLSSEGSLFPVLTQEGISRRQDPNHQKWDESCCRQVLMGTSPLQPSPSRSALFSDGDKRHSQDPALAGDGPPWL